MTPTTKKLIIVAIRVFGFTKSLLEKVSKGQDI